MDQETRVPATPADVRGGERARGPASEARYRELYEHAPDVLYTHDLDGRLTSINATAERLLGYTHSDARRLTIFDVVAAEHRRLLQERLDALRAGKHVAPLEIDFTTRDGGRVPAEISLRLILADGHPIEVHGCARTVVRRASEEQFRTIFEGAPIGIARLDLEGRVVDANRALERMSGYATGELRGRAFTDLVAGDDVEAAGRDLISLVAGGRETYQAERRYTQKDGAIVWANVTVSVVRDVSGQPQFCIGMVEDITDRKNAEEALRKSNKRLTGWVAELEQRTREIGLLSEMGDLLQACRSAEEAHAVIARMAPQVFPNVAGSVSVISVANNLVETVAAWGPPTGERVFGPDECWALRRGRAHLVEDLQLGLICKHMHRPLALPYVCVPMLAHGEALGLLNLNLPDEGRVSDALQRLGMTVAEHVALALANLRLHETLRAQSIRDPLTNLFNRRYMEESLEREMRRAVRGRHSVGIIMLDLDHFKRVNDEYGHEAGDTVLRELGSVLQRNIRGEDIACRYGGEEFTLILPEASLGDAAQRAEQLRVAIKALPIRYRKQTLGPITVSLGVAVFPDHGPTGEAVLRAADAALYQAKGRGRDRVTVNAGSSTTPETIVDWSGS